MFVQIWPCNTHRHGLQVAWSSENVWFLPQFLNTNYSSTVATKRDTNSKPIGSHKYTLCITGSLSFPFSRTHVHTRTQFPLRMCLAGVQERYSYQTCVVLCSMSRCFVSWWEVSEGRISFNSADEITGCNPSFVLTFQEGHGYFCMLNVRQTYKCA